jgi:hypothetical protein
MEEEHSSNDEQDDCTIETLLQEFTQGAETIQTSISTCKHHLRQVDMKVKEPQSPILHVKYKPRTASKVWLEAHGLSTNELSIQEFLDTFLTLYNTENRLDISSLTVDLRKEEAKLFHLPVGKHNFFDVLTAVPSLFH